MPFELELIGTNIGKYSYCSMFQGMYPYKLKSILILKNEHLQCPESAVSVGDQVRPNLYAMLSEVYQEYYFPQLSFV